MESRQVCCAAYIISVSKQLMVQSSPVCSPEKSVALNYALQMITMEKVKSSIR